MSPAAIERRLRGGAANEEPGALRLTAGNLSGRRRLPVGSLELPLAGSHPPETLPGAHCALVRRPRRASTPLRPTGRARHHRALPDPGRHHPRRARRPRRQRRSAHRIGQDDRIRPAPRDEGRTRSSPPAARPRAGAYARARLAGERRAGAAAPRQRPQRRRHLRRCPHGPPDQALWRAAPRSLWRRPAASRT